ncbi:methionine ABC transporter permease [Lachnobacterium bovis]|uniref:D-methionine transport system permease protein n=1 Tax=Lachnobacterium bovis TaxID=140626 RepID=A0A1H9TDY9_9FIRM|nr:methionine ABC transporter permease [Lachnobacterium bovis]SER95184.1 D-methionine transport system permease protein [Lachnobacterium bovis]
MSVSFDVLVGLLKSGIEETLYMTIIGTLLAYILGIPLGVLLYVTSKEGIKPNKVIYGVFGTIINIVRSIPFMILLVALIPFTRLVVGTSIGTDATIVPLVIGAAPFVARMIESSLLEVDYGVIEAALSMGASNFQIIKKVLLPEAKPSLLTGSTIAITTILGYSAMAGFVGGGGLGATALNYGYSRYQTDIMLITVVVLVIIVQIFQEVGMYIVRKTDKRKK